MLGFSLTTDSLRRVFILLILGITVTIVFVMPARLHPQDEAEKRRLAEEAANQFIERFHATLDVGVPFDEMALTDAVDRSRKAITVQFFGIPKSVLEEMDDKTAHRLYQAVTNFYYLRAVHQFSEKRKNLRQEPPEPPVIREALQKTRWLRGVLPEVKEDTEGVKTLQDVQEQIDEFERITQLYKERIKLDFFEAPIYKANVLAFNKKREAKPFEIIHDDKDFGFTDVTEIYVVRRDIFAIYFVNEKGKLKILTLGIGE